MKQTTLKTMAAARPVCFARPRIEDMIDRHAVEHIVDESDSDEEDMLERNAEEDIEEEEEKEDPNEVPNDKAQPRSKFAHSCSCSYEFISKQRPNDLVCISASKGHTSKETRYI